MKGIYWRPQKVSRIAFALVAVAALIGLGAVESLLTEERSARYEEKVRAAKLASAAQRSIRTERLARGYPIDAALDPTGTGLIGVPSSPITSNSGSLSSKQLSTNPNFAALMVELLDEAGVDRGDVVAVGLSGSFPGLNIATYSALTVLEAEPVVISSASASEWGANMIGFGWPDMEAHLASDGVFSIRSVAGSLGGVDDQGVGMSRAGRSMLRGMLERNRIPVIEGEELGESVDARLRVYEDHAANRPVAAYVNIGGGMASIGGQDARGLFRPGLNRPSGFSSQGVDSVMGRFLEQGVPVVHLTSIKSLAATYGLRAPEVGREPEIGTGAVYVAVRYNLWLAGGVLAFLLVALFAVTRSDLGTRLMASGGSKGKDRPQPMA